MDIPPEIEILKNDLIWARHYYNQYKKLFMVSQIRIELLNKTAPEFFRLLQEMFWDQMILRLARLTNPHKRGSDENLSAFILLKLDEENNWGFADEIAKFLKEAKDISVSIRKRRNKLVAHRDLPTAISIGAIQDPELNVTLDQIDKALVAIGRALNVVFLKLTNTTQIWDLISPQDVDELIGYLKFAMIYKEKRDMSQDWQKNSDESRNSKYRDA